MNLYEFLYSTLVHISLLTLIYVFLALFILYFIYSSIIEFYFSKTGEVCYKNFMDYFIQTVSKDNYFMNYGLWTSPADTLLSANKALVSLILEKSGALGVKDAKILDVGCGYGEQDFQWLKMLDPTTKITAVDISEYQIGLAKDKVSRSALGISFDVCNAMALKNKFVDNEFDTVLSVESAFHYANRPQFFQQVYDVLKEGGMFVISDIVLQDKVGILSSSFVRTFSDFLHMPRANHITGAEWEKTIRDSGLSIIECIDITDKTFNPYYNHFFKNYIGNLHLPGILATGLYNTFSYVQPFSYKVAVCKKVILA
jgi:erythromycin 3''-O-methyltransferase